jgi:serine/threonine-protein kinase
MSDSATADQLIAGRYRQIKRIGAGGMSVVVMAEDTVLKRTVALKLLAEHLAHDQDFVTRFRHEALSVARLQHANIVQVYDSGFDEASGRHFIVMEYVAGTPLSGLLANGQQLDPARAAAIADDACEALECAHRAGIVHRDVKPANLIVMEEGTAKLADFGIAKAAEQTRVTQVGSVLGTVAYLSPEQATGGDTGPRSDVYSLAVCAYEMLAGRLPYEYKSITELAMKQREERPEPITNFNALVPVELDRAIRVGLSYDPNMRFSSAREFAEAIRGGLARHESEFVTLVLSDPAAATRKITARTAPAATRRRGAAAGAAAASAAPASRTPLPPRGADGDPTAMTQVARPAKPPRGASKRATRPAPAKAPRARRGGLARAMAVLFLLAAVATAGAAGFMLGGSDAQPVIENSVQQQLDGIRNFIVDHS